MKAISFLVGTVALAVLSGCATDMRCQCVTERILMHEGSPWRMGTELDEARGSEHALFQKKKRLAAFGVANASDVSREFSCDKAPACPGGALEFSLARLKNADAAAQSAYAMESDKREKAEEILPLTGKEDELDREPCKSFAEQERDKQEAEQGSKLGRDSARPVPPSVEQARKRYLEGREIYLTRDRLSVADAFEMPLFLVNEGLTCRPRKKLDRGDNWRCRDLANLTPVIPAGELFERCRDRATGTPFHAVNLFGTLDDRFCVKVSLVEAKEIDNENSGWPSNINNDELIVRVSCATHGPAPPGAVVGGPRPNFRKPGSSESDK